VQRRLQFEVVSSLGKRIRTSSDHWRRIVSTKHPSMGTREDLVKQTLTSPEEVRRSKKDATVHLYYRKSEDAYCCVVAKHLNGDGFVITTYMTNKIKIGEQI
jgi:hypothetical protein